MPGRNNWRNNRSRKRVVTESWSVKIQDPNLREPKIPTPQKEVELPSKEMGGEIKSPVLSKEQEK